MSSGGRYQRVITYSVIGSVFSSSPPTPDAIRASPKSHTFRSQFLFTSRLLRVPKFVQLTYQREYAAQRLSLIHI